MMRKLLQRTLKSSLAPAKSIYSTTQINLYSSTSINNLARVTRSRKAGGGSKNSDGESPPPPSAVTTTDPILAWTPVTEPQSGQIYWWNTITNETTHLGAPKPLGGTLATSPNYAAIAPQQGGGIMQQQPQQGGGMLSGLGGVMAQGFAFGTGSAIAHNVVGSMFGGGSSHDSGSGGGGDSGDSWEM